MIANTAKQKPVSAPGKTYNYSDTRYLILGEVATKVTGTDIGTLIQRQILTPLGLKHTAYSPGSTVPTLTAHGYVIVHGKPYDATNWNEAWAGSAGAMVSTIGDLEAWAPALATGKRILDPSMQQQRLQMVNAGAPGFSYGLGILNDQGFLGHDGEVQGYNSVVLYEPQAKATLVALGTTSPLTNVPSQSTTLEMFPIVATALVRALPASYTSG